MKRLNALAIAMLLTTQLTACGGGGAASGPMPATSGGSHPQGTASMQITIPARTAQSAGTRSPQYISASTTQLLIDVQQGGVSVGGYPQTVGLTPTSPGCSVVAGATVCNLSLTLQVGSYLANLTAEDSLGQALSAATGVPISVAASNNNPVNVALSGVVASFSITPASAITPGTQSGGFTLVGAGARGFIVNALDADGNIIIGVGAPSIAISQIGGSLTVGITQPLITAPNQFYLTAPATLGTGSATVLVSAGTFSTSITVNMEPALAIVNDYSATTFGQATLYEEGSATPLVTLTQDFSTPNAAVFDPSGNLFISNLNGAVTEYSPPYTGTPTIISSGVSVPVVLAEDASGDLYVANNPGSLTGSVEEFAPGATTPSRTITAGISEPASMCVDPSGNLYVVDSGAPGGAINEFAPGATTASSSLTGLNFPQIIVCDPSGYTYVAYYGNDFGTEITDVTTYSPGLVGFSGLADITGPESLATDSSGNIYAGNGGGSTLNVLKFGTHGTGLPTETITAGLHLPKYIQVDAAGNIFVYDSSTNGVLEYDSGQTALSLTIPSPINYDIAAIALSN